MSNEKKELARLVKRCQKGDLEAFEGIYNRFFDRVYAYVFRQVDTAADTEDIVSGVFLEAFEKIDGFTWKGAGLAAWLFRIARNDVLDHYRRKGRWQETALPEQCDYPADTAHPAEVAEHNWENAELLDAVKHLSEEQRQVILLKLMFNFSNRQIAEVLEKNEGAVKALRHRAMVSLKQILEPVYQKDFPRND